MSNDNEFKQIIKSKPSDPVSSAESMMAIDDDKYRANPLSSGPEEIQCGVSSKQTRTKEKSEKVAGKDPLVEFFKKLFGAN